MKNPVNDRHEVQIDGVDVIVTGQTGKVHATWTLLIDGNEVDSAKAAGDFVLRGDLPNGPEVKAEVHQGLMGPTRVVVLRGDKEIARFQGFVA